MHVLLFRDAGQNLTPSVALNIFNWYNYSDYNTNFGSTGVLPANAVTYNPQGNLLGTPRMFKATLGVRF